MPQVTGEAERRYLTAMFTDLFGSTHLSQALGPEDLDSARTDGVASHAGASAPDQMA